MGKKKPKKSSSSSIEDASAQPVTEQQRPTRKRGRPRKIVIEEKDPAEGASEGADVQEEVSSHKKPRDGTEEPQQPQGQQKGAESSFSAPAGEVLTGRPAEKPRSRGRRKGRPHKST